MRIILTVLLSVIILAHSNANAVTCPTKDQGETECNKVAGCGWDGTTCSECAAGKYSGENQKCQKCHDSYPNSAKGSTSQNACYTECAPQDIKDTDGNKIGTKKDSDGKAFYDTSCNYSEITCNNPNDKCAGYHVDGSTCISNKQACTKTLTLKGTHNGIKFWDNTKGDYGDCYITECTGDRHLENLHTICNNIQYGEDCAANRGECISKLQNCVDGTVKGNYSWVNQYRYDDCTCVKQTKDDHGTYEATCKRTAGEGSSTQWGNCESITLNCIAGYCSKTPGKCEPTTSGYYHSNINNAKCEPCPMGSTSDSNADSIEKCYITSSTKFCDGPTDADCFSLPISKTYYKQN